MDPKDILEHLRAHPKFKTWKSAHEQDILAHIFLEPDNIQVGYFSPSKSTMTTFALAQDLSIVPDQEILRGDSDICALDVSTVTVSPSDALAAADAIRAEQYSKEQMLKTLTILQNIEGQTVYNITYFTASFKTLNVKVNAADGSVIRHSLGSLIDLERGQKNSQ